jgi:low affinity Fe/Cu permease
MSVQERNATMPSHESEHLGFFDRFATATAGLVSRAPFFALAVALVLAWLLEGVVMAVVTGDLKTFVSDTYQLQINTLTTIITFLLVALLQNTQTRADKATQVKLNAIADALADLMNELAEDKGREELRQDAKELADAVGLERVVSADDG